MHPTLLQFGSFRIDTYSVIWFIALALSIVWCIRRLALYDLDEDESRRIMAVSFFFMLIGARTPEYIINWRDYFNDPKLFLNLQRGNLYEYGAILGAFLSAFVMCMFSKKISFLKLCDAAAIPALGSIAIGRWGCFLNGCCTGNESNFFTAVHFPQEPLGITRHPVQIYYSVIAALGVLILLQVEKKFLPSLKKNYHSVIAPLALIFYSCMRLGVSVVREPETFSWLVSNDWTYTGIMIALPIEIIWFAWGLHKIRRA